MAVAELGLAKVAVRGVKARSGVAEQPVGESAGVRGARTRVAEAKAAARAGTSARRRVLVVGVENYVEMFEPGKWWDRAAVVALDAATGREVVQLGATVAFPADVAEEARRRTRADSATRESGFDVTVGRVLSERNPAYVHDDWHAHADFGGVPRAVLLRGAVVECLRTLLRVTVRVG